MVSPIYNKDKLGMSLYYKTAQGYSALEKRQFNLNVRQRRLLLLIGTDDFNQLNDQLKQKIATPELLQQLEEMELIQLQKRSTTVKERSDSNIESIDLQEAESAKSLNAPAVHDNSDVKSDIPNQHTFSEKQKPNLESPTHEPITIMAFDEIKALMAETLSRYCGLLARQLLEQIKSASNIKQLKICQMQWITHLQETRIPPQQLNQQLHQVNFALQQLQVEQ